MVVSHLRLEPAAQKGRRKIFGINAFLHMFIDEIIGKIVIMMRTSLLCSSVRQYLTANFV